MDENTFEPVESRIEEVYNSFMKKPLEVLNIFNDFFNAERVDMQCYPSLETFKVWFDNTPISTLVSKDMLSMGLSEWETYKHDSYKYLPESALDEFLLCLNHSSTVRSKIIEFHFAKLFILVHFPKVRVTNENNRFVDITHLYAKVGISTNGNIKGGFKLNRAEYPLLQFINRYMHSHVSGIPIHNFQEFQSPCLGRGPIIDTINNLRHNNDAFIWNMFCLELSKYVTVESISGVPYKRLENIGNYNTIVHFAFAGTFCGTTSSPDMDLVKSFIKYFIGLNKLKFNYRNGSYSIGMSYAEYMVLISNEFIKWCNTKFDWNDKKRDLKWLINNYYVIKGLLLDNKIYQETNNSRILDSRQYQGRKICTFKGKEITLNITEDYTQDNLSIFLHPRLAMHILTVILRTINYKYGKDEYTITSKKVRYLL